MTFQNKPPVRRAYVGLAGSPLAQLSGAASKPTPDEVVQIVATLLEQVHEIDGSKKTANKQILKAVGTVLPPIRATTNQPKHRGRPRKWANDAERKRYERAKATTKLVTVLAYFELTSDSEIPPGLRTKYGTSAKTYAELLNDPKIETRVFEELVRDLKLIGKIKTKPGSGRFIQDAPRGRGKLITGGYDSAKVDKVIGVREAEARALSKPEDTADDLIGESSLAGAIRLAAMTKDRRSGTTRQGNGPDVFDRGQE